MQLAGRESWRIGIGGEQAVHSLLFIRDVWGLEPSGADVPPSLVGGLPEIEPDLSTDERAEMSAAWLEWWRRFIHVEGATERGEFARVADRDVGRARQRAAVFAVFDPALQKAARQVCNQALQWRVEHRAVAPDRRSAWLAQKAVAESVIEEYQVGPSRVSAGVIVLEVSGQWSNIPEPGVLLCSSGFFVDDEVFLPALKRTFETGLRISSKM
jgi:hypothetical protein